MKIMKSGRSKKERASLSEEKAALNDTIDSAKRHRTKSVKRIIILCIGIFVSAVLGLIAAYLRVQRYKALSVINEADGASSVFVAGRYGIELSAVFAAVGVIVLMLSVIYYVRSKN